MTSDKDFYGNIIYAVTQDDISSISTANINKLLKQTKMLLQAEGPLLKLGQEEDDSFFVLGDIHGQYDDMSSMLHALSINNSRSKYLFLGDYVDRGFQSIHVMLILFSMKCMHPESIYLLRGNHESAAINSKYGFLYELQREFGIQEGTEVHEEINKVFDYMPLAATVCDQYFCVHGGISKQLDTLDKIEALVTPIDIDTHGTLQNEIVWADPEVDENIEWGHRINRGPTYGVTAVKKFLERTGLKGIIRAHQCVANGYAKSLEDKVLTIFSAPNYSGRQNKAGVAVINQKEIRVLQFTKMDDGSTSSFSMGELCLEFEKKTEAFP